MAQHQSLYEERCVTEEEYKKQQNELQEELKKRSSMNTQITPPPEIKNSKKS